MQRVTYASVANQINSTNYIGVKGSWTITHVERNPYLNDFRYSICMSFIPNEDRLPKAGKDPILFRIYFLNSHSDKQLKVAMKSCSGYTPEPHIVSDVMQHILKIIELFSDEDSYYASQCKTKAADILEDLYLTAINRYKNDEMFPPRSERYANSQLPIEKVLTADEIEVANEAQKVLNGHAYLEAYSYSFQTGHLKKINSDLRDFMWSWDRLKIRTAKANNQLSLKEALDTDIQLRRLVAVALNVVGEIRTSKAYIEISHRMFGYTTNLNDYRNVFSSFSDLMKEYGLETYEVDTLQHIGTDYLAAEGMLPSYRTDHEREEGKFYYGDRVHDGLNFFDIERVGKKFIYTNNQKVLKSKIQHLSHVTAIQNPLTVKDHIQNELIALHRSFCIPEAHLKQFEEVIIQLKLKSQKTFSKRFDYRLHNASSEEQKEAYRVFLNSLEYLRLQESSEHMKFLSTVTRQPVYEQVLQSINEIEQHIEPFIDTKLLILK